MKIEEMNIKSLYKASNQELYSLHLRFIQLWNKNFAGNRKVVVGSLERGSFLDKYKLLIKEIDKRKLTHSTQDIDRALFRKSIYGLEVSVLGDLVVIPDYVSVGGGFIKSPKEANDLDLVVREDERNRDEGMELKLSRLLQKQVKKDCHFVYNKTGAHSSYIPLFDLILRSKEETKRVEVKEDYSKSEEKLEKGCRPAFGSPGGKRFLAKKIVSYIPKHRIYCEPFIGGGAVFFAKEPSEVEVINDLDKEIAFAYRFMKKIDDEDLKKLKKKNWVGSKSHFENLKKNKPENDLERFYRFSYIMRFSRFKNYVSSFEGQEADCASALPNLKERLKNVKIENNDYKESINYDSKETFYYLDPPYPDTENKTIGGNISLIELHNFCRKIKGEFILYLNDMKISNEIFKDFNIKKVKVLQSFSNTQGTQEFRKELLISNFPLKKENIYLSKSDKDYYEGLDEWKQDFIYDFAEMAKNLEGKTILDLGCGTGRVMQTLINSDYYNYQVDGIDNNDIALAMCKEKGLEVKKLDLEKGKLPYEDNQYCNVIGLHILEHLKNLDRIVKEAIRVAENKVIFISPLGPRFDPTHKHEFSKIDDFKDLFDKNAEIKMVDHGDNTAIAVIDVTKIKKAKTLTPFTRLDQFPKPTMAGLTEVFSVEQIWGWCEDRLPLIVEPKLNGFRMVISKEGNKYRIITDGMKERSKYYPPLKSTIEKIPDDFILDCSMGIERNGKALPRVRIMTLMADKPELQENDVIVCTAFDLPYWKKDLHLMPFSERRKLLEQFFGKFLKGSENFDITEAVQAKNRSELEKWFKKFAKLPQSEGIMIKDPKGIWPLDGRWNDVAKLKIEAEIKVIVLERHSVKGGNWNYTCGLLPGDSDFKNLTEFRGKKYIDLGKCFNTKIKAEPGDILTMGVEEIIPQDDELDWLGARVLDLDRDRKEPYLANQVIGIAERANILQKAQHKRTECMKCSKPPEYEVLWAEGMAHAWFCKKHFKEWVGPDCEEHSGGFTDVDYVKEIKDGVAAKKFGDNKNPNIREELKREFSKAEEGGIDYKIGDTGKGVLQLHIMGIEEEKISELKKVSAEAVRSRANPTKLKMLLRGAIGEQGAHIDLRMVRKGDDYFEGGEIMIGNLTGLDKLKKLKEGDKLRFGWKVPRVEEPEAETIRGPVSWMTVGKRKLEIIPPGEVGATKYKYSAMLILDGFDWEAIEPQDKHAKKLKIKNIKIIPEGIYLFAYVPVTEAGKRGERVWMISKLKEEEKMLKFRFLKIDQVEHIVGGIVYPSGVMDSQGQKANSKEIWEALKKFMIKYFQNTKKINIMHKGFARNIPIIEIFQAEENTHKGGTGDKHLIKKGDWYMTIYLGDELGIWKKVESGELSGFSMEGRASMVPG